MKRIIITGAALLAAIPASLGLIGNASFAQSVPVRVPSQATPVGGQSRLSPRRLSSWPRLPWWGVRFEAAR